MESGLPGPEPAAPGPWLRLRCSLRSGTRVAAGAIAVTAWHARDTVYAAWCPCGRMKQSISGPAESKRVKSQLRNASGKQKAAVDTLTCRQPASPPCRRRHPLRRGAHGGPRIPARSGSDLHAGLSRPDERLSSSESCASVAPAPPPPPGGGGTRGGAASPAT